MSYVKKFLPVLATVFVILAVSAVPLMASSSPTSGSPGTSPDVYRVNYFLGLHAPGATGNDAEIVVLDPGTNGSGNLCADFYVLNPSEELEACCSCSLTPDEIIAGSVVTDLLSNNVSPITLHNGVIKIISDSACNAAAPTPTPELRAWLTEIYGTAFSGATVSGSTGVQTLEFTEADLSAAEESSLATRCGDIQAVGSGFGVCKCPTEPSN
jgi:hypothetical protein